MVTRTCRDCGEEIDSFHHRCPSCGGGVIRSSFPLAWAPSRIRGGFGCLLTVLALLLLAGLIWNVINLPSRNPPPQVVPISPMSVWLAR
jgi:hypothetical protein